MPTKTASLTPVQRRALAYLAEQTYHGAGVGYLFGFQPRSLAAMVGAGWIERVDSSATSGPMRDCYRITDEGRRRSEATEDRALVRRVGAVRYRYLTVRADGLRPGDEIKAADGESWLAPIRPRGVVRASRCRYGASDRYDIWTDTKPGYGGADHERGVPRRTGAVLTPRPPVRCFPRPRTGPKRPDHELRRRHVQPTPP